jgi:hypothetical protein
MEREPEDEGDDSEIEPSLVSFDRMADQSKAWTQKQGELCFSIDAEQDDADNEESDPAEPSLGSIDERVDQEDGDGQATAKTSSRTTGKPASPTKTDWTNKSRSATG